MNFTSKFFFLLLLFFLLLGITSTLERIDSIEERLTTLENKSQLVTLGINGTNTFYGNTDYHITLNWGIMETNLQTKVLY